MKQISLFFSTFSFITAPFLAAFVVSLTTLDLAAIAQTWAGHQTNKSDVRQSLEKNGWTVIYSKEFSHEEYLKLTAAIVADATVSSGSATYTYFSDFARQSLQQVLGEASRRQPDIYSQLVQSLTIDRILSGIKGSFNGRQISWSLAGIEFQIGRATY